MLAAPRAAALAGVLFALLMGSSVIIVRLAAPSSPGHPSEWLANPYRRDAVRAAVNLTPFAGIAFLWMIGVLRHRLGALEDRLYASVFLGSGLLFVASLYASAAFAGALVATVDRRGDPLSGDAFYLARQVAGAFLNVFAIKMAGVFTLVTSTIVLRTSILPRWIALSGYGCALVLLLVITRWPWIALLFPLWVLAMSLCILTAEFGRAHR
jgi:hypothetical protein